MSRFDRSPSYGSWGYHILYASLPIPVLPWNNPKRRTPLSKHLPQIPHKIFRSLVSSEMSALGMLILEHQFGVPVPP